MNIGKVKGADMAVPDKKRFERAYNAVMWSAYAPEEQKIGNLREKALHAVLKYYFEPDAKNHEVKIGNFYADAISNGKIIEIQTKNFYALRKKLDFMVISYKVTLVHPIAEHKKICWVDPSNGSVISSRKVSKKGRIYDILNELYAIKEYVGSENFTLCIMLVDVDEYRLLDGYGKDKKMRATKYERVPTSINSEFFLSEKRDYYMLIPPELGERFTASEFNRAIRMRGIAASCALKFLIYIGTVRLAGKEGRQNIYEVCETLETTEGP